MTNWGIISTANIAKNAMVPAIELCEGNRLIAVSSRDLEKAKDFVKDLEAHAIEGYDNLLDNDDIDSVYIPLPTGMHYEWVKKALLANKNVLVEKTAFTNLDQAKEMLALAESKDLVLMENFQFQFHSQHAFVKKLILDNEIGKIRTFRSAFGFPPFQIDNNIRYKKELGGGALLDAGAYTLKVVDFLFKQNFELTNAFLAYHSDFKVDWYGGGMLVNSGKNIFAQIAFGFENYYQCNYEIWGSNGRIVCHRAYTAKPGYNPIVTVEKDGELVSHELPSDNHFLNMMNQFNKAQKNSEIRKLEYGKLARQANQLDAFYKIANQK